MVRSVDSKMVLSTRHAARDQVAKLCFDMKRDSKGRKKRVPRGMVSRLVHNLNNENKGLGLTAIQVRRKIDRLWSKHNTSEETSDPGTESETDVEEDDATDSSVSSKDVSQSRKKGGRPVNTSTIDIAAKKQAKVDLMNLVASEFQKLREGMGPKRISSDKFSSLILQCKTSLNINPDDDYFEVPRKTIAKRISRGVTIVKGKGPRSPVQAIEGALIDLLLTLSDMNKPLSVGEGVLLANELIEDKKIGDAIRAWKIKNRFYCDQYGRNTDGTILGSNWWRRFMKQNKSKLSSGKGHKFSCNREDWCTYQNFLNMYHCIYDEMLLAGVAAKIEVPVYMDREGNPVSVDNAYGRKCTHKLVRPDMCFVFDETGGNTCMKNDGHAGGKKYIRRTGQAAKMRASESDNHFTSLTVSALTGESALCAVIFKGKLVVDTIVSKELIHTQLCQTHIIPLDHLPREKANISRRIRLRCIRAFAHDRRRRRSLHCQSLWRRQGLPWWASM